VRPFFEIAAELVVSIRTVENRLQNVYSKLGVSSRRRLGDALATMDKTATPWT
jgi:DNA-binding NarL/FixJ family response regulator